MLHECGSNMLKLARMPTPSAAPEGMLDLWKPEQDTEC